MHADNIRFIWDFPTDKASLTFTSENANMPGKYVQNQQVSKLWRSISYPVGQVADQEFVFSLEKYTPFSAIVLWNINLSITSQVRLILALNEEFTEITFDQTWAGVRALYGYGEGPYGAIPYGGYSLEGLVNYPFFVKFFDAVPGTFVKVLIIDPQNPSGYIQAGKIALGYYFSPEFNLNYGYTPKYQFQSKQSLSRSGAIRTNRRVKNKEIPISLNYLSMQETQKIDDAIRDRDMNKNILVSVYPNEGTTRERKHIVLGFLKEGTFSGITREKSTYKCSFTIIEGK